MTTGQHHCSLASIDHSKGTWWSVGRNDVCFFRRTFGKRFLIWTLKRRFFEVAFAIVVERINTMFSNTQSTMTVIYQGGWCSEDSYDMSRDKGAEFRTLGASMWIKMCLLGYYSLIQLLMNRSVGTFCTLCVHKLLKRLERWKVRVWLHNWGLLLRGQQNDVIHLCHSIQTNNPRLRITQLLVIFHNTVVDVTVWIILTVWGTQISWEYTLKKERLRMPSEGSCFLRLFFARISSLVTMSVRPEMTLCDWQDVRIR